MGRGKVSGRTGAAGGQCESARRQDGTMVQRVDRDWRKAGTGQQEDPVGGEVNSVGWSGAQGSGVDENRLGVEVT